MEFDVSAAGGQIMGRYNQESLQGHTSPCCIADSLTALVTHRLAVHSFRCQSGVGKDRGNNKEAGQER